MKEIFKSASYLVCTLALVSTSFPTMIQAQVAGKTRKERMVICPEKTLIFDNTCYIDTGNPPKFGSDPTAKPICYPGTFVKLPNGSYYCVYKGKRGDGSG